MDSFKPDESHLRSHRGIHEGKGAPYRGLTACGLMFPAGLDSLAVLIHKWKAEPSTYSPIEMKACLDNWRDVLFRHLDEEAGRISFLAENAS